MKPDPFSCPIYNRLAPVASKEFAKQAVDGLVTQVKDYLDEFDHLIYESNSLELINQLKQQLIEAGMEATEIAIKITFRHVP